MSWETGKAVARRIRDPNFLSRYFVGQGIDIGSGEDPLSNYRFLFPLCQGVAPFDKPQGDAQLMAGCADAGFDFVSSSHCLEHMRDPLAALDNWLRILRPGGHLVVLVPDEDMYEQGVWPSRFNRDHRWTFATWKRKSWSPKSLNMIDLLRDTACDLDIIKVERLTATFMDPHPLGRGDQTLFMAESAIEAIARKM